MKVYIKESIVYYSFYIKLNEVIIDDNIAMEDGDLVSVLGSKKVGIVVKVLLTRKKVIVSFGKNEICFQLKDVKVIGKSTHSLIHLAQLNSSVSINFEKQKKINFHTEVDFHGFLIHEALDYLDIWIDKALFNNEKNLTIIHGKGSGILRTAIRHFLKNHKHIRIKEPTSNYNNNGITQVELI